MSKSTFFCFFIVYSFVCLQIERGVKYPRYADKRERPVGERRERDEIMRKVGMRQRQGHMQGHIVTLPANFPGSKDADSSSDIFVWTWWWWWWWVGEWGEGRRESERKR